jgi:uncharacterized protein
VDDGGDEGSGQDRAEKQVVARRRPLLEELAARLPAQSRVVVQDLSMPDAGPALAAATADLDVGLLVYNAGADDHSLPFLEQPADDLRVLVRRNCLTVLDACHSFGARLVARGRGGVILVTSGAAWAGGGNIAAYGATKAFDLVLAEALWAEWRGRGVDVLALVLGATDTPSLRRLLARRGGALPDLAQPEVVACVELRRARPPGPFALRFGAQAPGRGVHDPGIRCGPPRIWRECRRWKRLTRVRAVSAVGLLVDGLLDGPA